MSMVTIDCHTVVTGTTCVDVSTWDRLTRLSCRNRANSFDNRRCAYNRDRATLPKVPFE
jgi:hypothetical protein